MGIMMQLCQLRHLEAGCGPERLLRSLASRPPAHHVDVKQFGEVRRLWVGDDVLDDEYSAARSSSLVETASCLSFGMRATCTPIIAALHGLPAVVEGGLPLS